MSSKSRLLITLAIILIGATSQAQISAPAEKKPVVKQAPPPPAPSNFYKVNTAEEFVKAIGSNRTIELQGSRIYLPDAFHLSGPNFSFGGPLGGKDLIIKDVQNLKIVGAVGRVEIMTEPKFGEVIIFNNCTNVELESLYIGHGEKGEGCEGGVIQVLNSRDMLISNCTLYGSGTSGIYASNVTGLLARNSTITGCTATILIVVESTDVLFNVCYFQDNRGLDMISSYNNVQSVKFKSCTISNNTSGSERSNWSFFVSNNSAPMIFDACTIRDNRSNYMMNQTGAVSIINSINQNNTFDKGETAN